MNMIHRDDLTQVIIAALERGAPGEIYNAVDEEPVTQLKFFEWLAAELKRLLPPTVATDAGDIAQARSDEQAGQQLKVANGTKIQVPLSQFSHRIAAEITRLF